ncbi:hypothetical protein N8616_01290 [Verrucomicrobia bacterium]|nr:hypothetical protein [Verrucomicrobiota bacterium]MDA7532977.1 hypothetical protein [Verrucomicrobiota bacterium]MDB4744916.1 hypothetical protein [Verrucomicrobiota bacterium]
MPIAALDIELRKRAKALLASGMNAEDVGRALEVRPGTVREWKRRYEWGTHKEEETIAEFDEIDDPALIAEYRRIMSEDVMRTLDRFARMPVPRKIDEILKRERCLELLSRRGERVMAPIEQKLGANASLVRVESVTRYLNNAS